MKSFIKKGIIPIMLVSLLFGLSACSASSDPVTDVTRQFAAINRMERQNAGSLQFTEEQAAKLVDIIAPVVTGLPLTPELAKGMLEEMDQLLTDEQKELVEESMANAPGVPGQGGGPGDGSGMPGGGTGVPGSGGGTPGSGNPTNMLMRLDETITNNYLSK